MSGGFRFGQPREARPAAVAGAFYPADPGALQRLVGRLLEEARPVAGRPPAVLHHGPVTGRPAGILVPHAGLVYSGLVAATAWQWLLAGAGRPPSTIVLLGTNHRAAWLDGVGVWETGRWSTPSGDLEIESDLAGAIVGLGPPFGIDRAAHADEHSIEVQLPFVTALARESRIVPLAVSAGTGAGALAAGERLGTLLASRRDAGEQIALAISSDMAHYPPAAACARATEDLLPAILALDGQGLATEEHAIREGRTPDLVCGMCGIEPAVLGLAALRALGASHAVRLASATSADAGGPRDRTVGYLAVAFAR